ncbi:hypothetical protein TNCV_788421 [Trichonephila clavipes]|nr:hypothetical protein TNCV_788421 [Trichonephila clavipes]
MKPHSRSPRNQGLSKNAYHPHFTAGDLGYLAAFCPAYARCAKIKDEVEKLAYQLNEEAERTERPIRRLAVKNHTELLPQREMANNQSVRRHLDAFTRGLVIWEVGEGRSVTSVAAEFRDCSQHRFTTLKTISNYRNSYPGFSSGRPRGTTCR